MKIRTRRILLRQSVLIQGLVTTAFWLVLAVYLYAHKENWDPKLSVASFVAIPAAVIGVAQLVITTMVQRASYIKDYALRFRTDKELSESFHYLIYRFDNNLYHLFLKKNNKTQDEMDTLRQAQESLPLELCFFDPRDVIRVPQERRLDNLLGFFDTVGYDLSRGILDVRDVAGVFGFHLDHLRQRRVVQDYLEFVEERWPKLPSFNDAYRAPVPFEDLRRLIREYVKFRKSENDTA